MVDANDSREGLVGRRVLICGLAGSGKTTLARALASISGLDVIESDRLIYNVAWKARPPADRVNAVVAAARSRPEGWICDGADGATLGPVLALADTVVWLRLPFHLVWLRLVRRHIAWSWRREKVWGDHEVTWRASFLHPDSVVWRTLRQRRAFDDWIGETLRGAQHGCSVFELRSDAAVSSFFARPELTRRRPVIGPGI